jgi:flagellin-specific chaperone FliS
MTQTFVQGSTATRSQTDNLLTAIRRARRALASGDLEGFEDAMDRAQACAIEICSRLDPNRGAVGAHLYCVIELVIDRFVEARFTADDAPLVAAARLCAPLCSFDD